MIRKMFLDHPASVDESYGEHFLFALGFSFSLFYAAFAALIHAFIPSVCETTASKVIMRLHARISNR